MEASQQKRRASASNSRKISVTLFVSSRCRPKKAIDRLRWLSPNFCLKMSGLQLSLLLYAADTAIVTTVAAVPRINGLYGRRRYTLSPLADLFGANGGSTVGPEQNSLKDLGRIPPCGRCGGTTLFTQLFTQLQLIKAAFVAVLETRSVESAWLQREREREMRIAV